MITGKVIYGKGFGSSILGIPTANLDVLLDIDDGIYYGYATLYDTKYKMVMSTGIPPNFPTKRTVEVHLLDLPPTITTFYNEILTIEITGYIRQMDKYESIELLIAAINKDITYARSKLKPADISNV
jgi:FAD synthase